MKHLSLILFFVIVLASCKKEGNGGCISRVSGVVPVSPADLASIQTLLNNNHITANDQVFVVFRSYPGSADQSSSQYAESTQIRNGLPIFYGDLYYPFTNGISQGISGRSYGAISLDNKPALQVSGLRQLFLNEAVNKQGYNKSFNDSCYQAQFGYININLFSADTTVNFVKAWQVHPKNSLFPQCYIRDDNGSTIYFDSGIRFFAAKEDR